MNLLSLTGEDVSTVLPQELVEAAGGLSNFFLDVDIPKNLTSAVLNNNFTGESVATMNVLEDSLMPTISSTVEALTGEDFTEHELQLAAAAGFAGAVMAADLGTAAKHSVAVSTTTESVHVVNGVSAPITSKKLTTECFKSSIEDNLQEHSCMFNLRATGPNEFVRNVAPFVLFKPSENGLRCTIEIVYIQDDATHSVSGDVIDFNRRSLVRAYNDPTIIGTLSRKITPIVRDGGSAPSIDKFVPDAELAFTNPIVDGTAHQSGILKTGIDIDMIGITQSDKQIAQGPADVSDRLNEVAALDSLYVKLDAGKWLKVNVSGQSSASFFKPNVGQGNVLGLNLNAIVAMDKDTTLTNATLLSAEIPELDPANNGGKEYKVFVKVGATGSVDIADGTTTVTGSRFTVVSVYDGDTAIDLTTGDGKAIKEGLEGDDPTQAKCRIQGWYPDFTMANLNYKRRNKLIGKLEYTEEVYVPFQESISCPREVGASRDPEEVETLVRITHAAMDNAAVDLLLNSSAVIQDWKDHSVPTMLPDSLGITRYVTVPSVYRDNVDVAGLVFGLSTKDRHADITAVIINKLRNAIYTVWSDSGMDAVKSALGVSGRKSRIVIAADPRLQQYLYTIGDDRLIGDKFDTKIVTTMNDRFKGKLMAFPSSLLNDNKCDCTNFAHTAYTSETVTNLDLPVNGGVQNVLSVYGRWRMFMTNPVLVDLTVENVEQAYAP